MKNKTENRRSPFRLGSFMMGLAGVLLCLTMISTHMTADLYARYVTTTSGSDAARVAGFSFGAVSKWNEDAQILCTYAKNESSGTYTVTVKQASEVAVKYDVTVTVQNLTGGVTLKLDNKTADETDTQGDTTTLTYKAAGTFATGTHTANHVLSFNVDWAEFTKDASGLSHSETLTFSVAVNAEQID